MITASCCLEKKQLTQEIFLIQLGLRIDKILTNAALGGLPRDISNRTAPSGSRPRVHVYIRAGALSVLPKVELISREGVVLPKMDLF